MKLSDKIRIIRKARGLSQEALGDSLSRVSENGISRRSVSDWENGKAEPKLDNIRDLAEVLNVSFDALLDENIDLNDNRVLSSVLKHLSPEMKQTVNSKFRYDLRVSTLSWRSFRGAIALSIILVITVLFTCIAFFCNWGDAWLFIVVIGGSCILPLLPSTIIRLVRISKKGESVIIGELNNTHIILNTYKEASNTLYIPIDKIEDIKLGEYQKRKYGDIIIAIKGRAKPITVLKLMSPQKLIDIYKRISSEKEEVDSVQIV